MTTDSSSRIIEQVVREEWGRLLSIVVSYTRDLELAEDVTQDAVIAALTHWKEKGIPKSPLAWLVRTARRKAIDRIRRHHNFERKRAEYEVLLELEQSSNPEEDPDEANMHIPDERLRLVFTCCHPALAESARVALTLRTLGGLTTAEIARAFLVSEETMAQRLVRAKRKIRVTKIPYEVPEARLLEERLQSVLSVLYLIFNEGFSVTTGENLSRLPLCDEAIRLAQMLDHLMPDTPEVLGLLALMLLHDARKNGRVDETGAMVPLEAQDRTQWNNPQIKKGGGNIGWRLGANGVWGNMGVAAAPLLTGFILADYNWQLAFIIPGVLSILTGIGFVMFVRRGRVKPPESTATEKAMVGFMPGWPRALLAIAFVTSAGGFVFGTMTFVIPRMFEVSMPDVSVNVATTGLLAALVYALASFAQLVVGRLIDRHNIRSILLVVAIAQPLLIGLMSLQSNLTLFFSTLAAMAFVFGQIPITDAVLSRYVPDVWRAKVLSVKLLLNLVIGALALLVARLILEAGEGFDMVMFVAALIACFITAAALLLPPQRTVQELSTTPAE